MMVADEEWRLKKGQQRWKRIAGQLIPDVTMLSLYGGNGGRIMAPRLCGLAAEARG
jgi:hypothetical protein